MICLDDQWIQNYFDVNYLFLMQNHSDANLEYVWCKKIKHFDREGETTVIETQDEKAAALHHLCIVTSHMLVSQCFTF